MTFKDTKNIHALCSMFVGPFFEGQTTQQLQLQELRRQFIYLLLEYP